MADLIINMKQGDTAPLPAITLIDADGDPFDLTGSTPKFNVIQGNTLICDHLPMVVDNALGGVVHFDAWNSVNPTLFAAMVGDCKCEVEVTLPNGQTRTWPNAEADGTAAQPNIILRVARQIA